MSMSFPLQSLHLKSLFLNITSLGDMKKLVRCFCTRVIFILVEVWKSFLNLNSVKGITISFSRLYETQKN